MLQQTQVAAVIPYYARFLAAFPTLAALSQAPIDDVLARWAGLGYYARARNLHAAAQKITTDFGGAFPQDPALIASLPGIGRSTANAIAAFAFGVRAPILDGNVKRVLARHRAEAGYPGTPVVEAKLWQHALALLPARADAPTMARYTQGMMDIGAQCCTRREPTCMQCPLKEDCLAHARGLTAELPTPRPSKALPERAVTVLSMTHDDAVLVERRPARGIWGGLYSLPEFVESTAENTKKEAQSAPQVWLQSIFKIPAAQISMQACPPFIHTFTHFRLTISPYMASLNKPLTLDPKSSFLWLRFADIADAPLPAPIKKFLRAQFRV